MYTYDPIMFCGVYFLYKLRIFTVGLRQIIRRLYLREGISYFPITAKSRHSFTYQIWNQELDICLYWLSKVVHADLFYQHIQV